MAPIDLPAPIGCHFCEVDGVWEISIFAANTEVVGGRRDGRCFHSKFTMELLPILWLFDDGQNVTWQNAPVNRSDELGAHLSLDADYRGHAVRLHVLAQAPRRFEAGRQLLVHENAIVESW